MEDTIETVNELNEEDKVETSILQSIKKLLGIAPTYTNFDTDIIIHINTVFMTLNQLGVGPDNGFSIKGSDEKWHEYISDEKNLESIKTYIYLKVKKVFDPPLNTTVMEALKQEISELEWRLNIQNK